MPDERTEQPKRLKAIAMPRGFAARNKKWAEEDARAAAFRAAAPERKKAQAQALSESMRKRVANGTAPHFFIKDRGGRKATDPKRIWDNYRVIGTIRKSTMRKIQVSAGTISGYRSVCIKEYYKRYDRDEWLPSYKSITIPLRAVVKELHLKEPTIPEFLTPMQDLLALVYEAIEVASTMELHDPNNEVWIQRKIKSKNKQEDKQNENQ